MDNDDVNDDLKARIQELEDELQKLKEEKRQEYSDSTAVDEEMEEVHDQIRDEADQSGMSRRNFMKAIAGGGAALGAAAMMPSAAALDIESNNPLSYNDNFSVDTQGNLNLQGNNITNAGSVGASSVTTDEVDTTDLLSKSVGTEEISIAERDIAGKRTIDKFTVRVYPQDDTRTYFDREVTEEGPDADLIPTLQNIHDNFAASGAGVKVRIGPGNYWVRNGDNLNITSRMEIVGSGRGATTIRAIENYDTWTINVQANGTTIRDLFLNGNGNGGGGIKFEGARDCSLERCAIALFRGAGLKLTGSVYYFYSSVNRIDECNKAGLHDAGLVIEHNGNAGPNISNFISTQVYNTVGAPGVVVDQAGNVNLRGCTIENNDGAGMKVRRMNGLLVSGTRFEGNNKDDTVESGASKAEVVLADTAGMSSFAITGSTISGDNTNGEYHISLGAGNRVSAGYIAGNKFGNDGANQSDIHVGSIDSEGVYIGPNFFTTSPPVDGYDTGLLLLGVGQEATAGGTPTTADWPTGSVVEDSDNPGTLYHLLPSGNWG